MLEVLLELEVIKPETSYKGSLKDLKEDYLPSTMYNDYAKNSELFNWESQDTIFR